MTRLLSLVYSEQPLHARTACLIELNEQLGSEHQISKILWQLLSSADGIIFETPIFKKAGMTSSTFRPSSGCLNGTHGKVASAHRIEVAFIPFPPVIRKRIFRE
ncbi:hypothetical protein B1207_06385 [Legionella quinlivanii]|uniref:Uncharacterized protein n=1 Tax=Legionella quinlivanii TaxID=45073 RepID=A0A364LKA7_9GAMM|nr:hypothetical protein B1207_06385 [Legionella quinlivanii]